MQLFHSLALCFPVFSFALHNSGQRMDELASFWNYQESVDEMKQKLMYTNLELETVKLEMNAEMKKNLQLNEEMKRTKESMKNLLHLLKVAYKERDEARHQLQKLVNKFMPSGPTDLANITYPQLQPENLLLVPGKANSSITDSSSLSHGSSQIDSFLEPVSSPEFSNINVIDSNNKVSLVNQPLLQDYASPGFVSSGTDDRDVIIDSLVKGKCLPAKGKLLQAVVDAGPLLQTLMVAGPLPNWRNPPTLQPTKIPPYPINNFEATGIIDQKPLVNNVNLYQKSLISSPLSRISRRCSASVMNFAGNASGPWTSSASANNQVQASKGQRLL